VSEWSYIHIFVYFVTILVKLFTVFAIVPLGFDRIWFPVFV